MAFGSTPKDSTGIPLGSVYTPNNAGGNLTALQGGPVSTDSESNISAPVATYTPDGNSVTLGMQADSAATDNTSAWSEIALLKGVLGKLLTSIAVTGTISATNPSVGTDGATLPTSSTLLGASDGTDLQQLLVESASNRNLRAGIYSGANEATVTGANALKVDGSAVTQPVSAASLPLPTGAATAANQTTGNISLATIATNTTGLATDAHASSTATNTSTIAGAVSGTKLQNNIAQIGGASYALGAATIANSLPVTNAAVQGWIAATGTGTASQDDALTFASQVRKVVLYNASASPVPLEFDQTSSATSWPLQPGQSMVIDDVLCTVVHVFPSATLPINTTAGLYVKGWT